MTIETFNKLSEQEKVELIFDANKITEKVDNEANYQLFQIDNFFVEAKRSLDGKFKRSFIAYSLKELPVEYAGEVLSIPIVILDGESQAKNLKKSSLKTKKVFTQKSNRFAGE
jgi:hypothetical protein